jgi:hypothetical protein
MEKIKNNFGKSGTIEKNRKNGKKREKWEKMGKVEIKWEKRKKKRN